MKRLLTCLMMGVLFGIGGTILHCEESVEKGLKIAQEMDRRDNGFKDFKVDMEMILRNRHGQESKRVIRLKTLEVPGDGDKSMSIFDEPRDVKGTAFLSYTHKSGSDDQWLYLPALRRVKRIASDNKSGSFMGSEFAFEDIVSQEVEKYTYRHIRDDNVGGKLVFVQERYPVDKSSGYSKQIVFIDGEEYIPLKIDFYDRKGDLLKTLEFKGYQQYSKKFWRANEMDMTNHQSGKSTTLVWRNYQFNQGLSARDFDYNALKRAK
ncbi:MAG: outer membrane lipoprotein-sorting protein [Candidatus Margulisbacteria bacterium]|nr:outer membrane lipoprotein-sorting protein [Candidatus Margulisiibacteriota bacterium]